MSVERQLSRLNALAHELRSLAQKLDDRREPSISRMAAANIGRGTPSRTALLNATRFAYRARRLRDGFFDPRLFGEPGWDMLLALYESALSHQRMTTGSLCRTSEVPPTTALRWIEELTATGLVCCEKSEDDRRVRYQVLTAQGFRAMTLYFTRLMIEAEEEMGSGPALPARLDVVR